MMSKTELVRQVARETGLRQRVVSQVVAASLRTVQRTLVAGERVSLPGFGTFYTRDRQAGRIRSLQTGRQIEISARRVAAFRVGAVLKRAVAGRERPKRRRKLFGFPA